MVICIKVFKRVQSKKVLHAMKLWIICILFAATCKSLNINDNTNKDRVSENKEAENILSRRRRFLLFPTGSSFQLVICVQTSALIPLGDIFLYANTASLAWELPTDPKFLYMFKHSKKNGQRRGDDEHHIYYTNEKGDVIAKIPYKRRKIVSASIGKRSLDSKEKPFKEKLKIKIDRMKMHEKQSNREYMDIKHKDFDSITYHRNSRSGLLKKIEELLTAVGHEGRQCVLYHLCIAAQRSKQGTFFQEMLRIIFTLPKSQDLKSYDDTAEYDNAHTPADDCAVRYSGCEKLQINL